MTWHRKIPGQAACGPCCGIKEKLQTLWDRTINSILRINQVEPDDQGNIRITSDSEALTVTEGTNEIILGLDTSELPAAAVTSVNGETGAVQLTGADIPSLYNGTVNSNLAGLWGTKAQTSALNTEISNRQQADTTLQNNINALQASIPQEAADAVAADPTVQSFAAAAADIPNKVDKRTGSGLRAYTHDGSTQDDTVVEDSTNGATIPIRDANGRLQAADPAAGATDKTLTTANWVSQTGDSAPNNLLHKSGTETKNGRLDVITPSLTRIRPNGGKGPQNYANKFYKLFTINKGTTALVDFEVITNGAIMRCIYDMRSDGLSHAYVSIVGDRFIANKAIVTTEKDNIYTAWLQNPQNRGLAITIKNLHNLFSNMAVYDINDSRLNWIYDGTLEDEPAAADYDSIKYSEAFQ